MKQVLRLRRSFQIVKKLRRGVISSFFSQFASDVFMFSLKCKDTKKFMFSSIFCILSAKIILGVSKNIAHKNYLML